MSARGKHAAPARGAGRHRVSGRVLMAVGAVLVVAACVVAGVRWYGQATAQRRGEDLAARLSEALQASVPVDATGAELDPTAMPALEVAGVDLIGRVQVEAIGLDAPVVSEQDDWRLVPAREERADGDETRVLLHGSAWQADGAWGRIGQLQGGEEVVLQAMDGAAQKYAVVSVGLTREYFNDDFDLVLYYSDASGVKTWAGCTKAS